ncbi:MAG TPA: PAS domain-containing protein [Gaiellaceae bacterium]|nr:PAS domain-containing protein [Gaiellaceae bacterium]
MVASLDERILREALIGAEAAITVFSSDRRILAVNERYLELTGYSREDVERHRVGENLRLDPLAEERFVELITSATSAGEADILRRNGEPLAVEYVVIPTEVDGERHFIGMMWPLVAAEPPPAGTAEEALTREAE